MKRIWKNPIISSGIQPYNDTIIVPGSGQSNTDPYPCTYAEWQTLFAADYTWDSIIDEDDYGQWWANHGLSVADWEEINPGVPFIWEPDED